MERVWLVSKDAEVEAALNHPDLLVRPPDEQVPKAMQNTLLGDVFARLARMNEGERHDELRDRVTKIIGAWDMNRVRSLTREATRTMPAGDIGAYVVAVMSGIEQPMEAMPLIRDFAGAITGGASDDAIARGIAATPRLLEQLPHIDDADERANRLGFLFQAYAATAALIEHRQQGRAAPPVILTRRWAASDLELFGLQVKRGDAIAVLLTSQRFHFGSGPHACPGKHIAEAIANAVSP